MTCISLCIWCMEVYIQHNKQMSYMYTVVKMIGYVIRYIVVPLFTTASGYPACTGCEYRVGASKEEIERETDQVCTHQDSRLKAQYGPAPRSCQT